MSILDQLQVTDPDEPVAPAPAAGAKRKSILQLELTPKKVPLKELMHFSSQLAVFIRAGVPLLDALETVGDDTGDKVLEAVLADVVLRLRGGATLAAALEAHGEVFPSYYLGILRSAELTGRLDDALDQLSVYIERDVEARSKITSALIYPAIIAVMSVGVVIVLVTFVLPRFEAFFTQLHAKLPLPTRILLGASRASSKYWYVLVAVGAVLLLSLFVVMFTEPGRRFRDRLLLRLPIIGPLIQQSVLERFCRILASLMSAGVSFPLSMLVVAEATTNRVYSSGIRAAREDVLQGAGLAESLAATGLFPASARQIFRVAEQTGTLDRQLETAATFFERELDHSIKRFTALFEPIVISIMGLIVGFVAVALVSAMYGIYNQVHV